MAKIRVTNGESEWACPEAYLPKALAQGWTPVDNADLPAGLAPPFDPSEHDVDAVNKHLASNAGDQAEVDRVLAAEVAGKNRSSIKAPAPDGQPG